MTAAEAGAETGPTHPAAGWIGPAPTAVQQFAAVFVGVVGIMFAGVGPLLLGGLEAAGRLSAAQLGQAEIGRASCRERV